MIDHVVLNVSDLAASVSFYAAALEPLGVVLLAEHEGYVGFGERRHAVKRDASTPLVAPLVYLWLAERSAVTENLHVAFASPDRATVDRFYESAMTAGGVDNGPPGVRTVYHPHYYGAFVLDPDRNNVEAVCHEPAR